MTDLLNLIQASPVPLALATITARSGSAPRGAGAQMLVSAAGRLWGTVGGGMIEQKALLLAQTALETRRGSLHEFNLDAQGARSIGMVCGGDVTLLVQYLPPHALSGAPTARDGWLASTLDAQGQSTLELLTPAQAADRGLTGRAPIFRQDAPVLFAQPLAPPGVVYLFGGGHVARELSPLLSRLDFRHVVLDDRPDFAKPEDFPGAERVVCTDFRRVLDHIVPRPEDAAAVMTHGHGFDLEVQKVLLTTPIGYIGVMGSRKKRDFVFGKLRESGFMDADLARVVTPIGLPLGGETPAEIALSIAAQLVQRRAGNGS